MYLISLCMFYMCIIWYEIKLNSLDKFSVDSHFRTYLVSVEWFGRWSVQPNLTFLLFIYFVCLVERIKKSRQDPSHLLEWECPWIYIIEVYLWTKSRYFLFNSKGATWCQAVTFHNAAFQCLILAVFQHQLAP
jgi:hypothetical protein